MTSWDFLAMGLLSIRVFTRVLEESSRFVKASYKCLPITASSSVTLGLSIGLNLTENMIFPLSSIIVIPST